MTPDQIHAEARSLQENEAFAVILSEIDAEARDQLVSTPAEQTERIRDAQALARAVQTIRERVKLKVLTTAPKASPGLK